MRRRDWIGSLIAIGSNVASWLYNRGDRFGRPNVPNRPPRAPRSRRKPSNDRDSRFSGAAVSSSLTGIRTTPCCSWI